MYYDDMYHPTNSDAESIMSTEYSSAVSAAGSNKRSKYDYKKEDKGYHRIGKGRSKIEIYDSTNSFGYRIRDPITGARLHTRIGSKDEYNFFKVRMSGIKRETTENTPITLYYDSPEHFERHQKTNLPDAIKTKWWREHREVVADDDNESNNSVIVVK